MDDGEAAPPAAKKRRTMGTPHMPHELVSEILAHLPVETLMRFNCACKAWRSTISGDASFHRAHLRLQKPCLLLSPNTWFDHHDVGRWRKVGLYRWEPSQGTEAPLMDSTYLPCTDRMHGLAHCDGLVLVSSHSTMRMLYGPDGRELYEGTVRVLNPATRPVLTLPWSPGSVKPPQNHHPLDCNFLIGSHQAFGLGRDPRSSTYKVARFFYRTVPAPVTGEYHYTSMSGDHHYTARMEVFTVGVNQQWRETAANPPYPAATRQTAIFFQGSLLWTVEQRALREPAPRGFLRFNLADETFGITPFPHPPSRAGVTSFAELRGELCVARVHDAVEMWMCADVNDPRWELRHEVVVPMSTAHLYPVGVVDGDVVFNDKTPRLLRRYNLRTKMHLYPGKVSLMELRYRNPSTGTLEYQRKAWSPRQDDDASFEYPLSISSVDVIPYVQSLVPV